MSNVGVKRSYVPSEDEDALVYLWTSSLMRGQEGQERGAFNPRARGGGQSTPEVREAARKFWSEQAPLAEMLLRSCDTELVCDPARPRATAEGPAVIWGWACTTGDVVHYVSVKRPFNVEFGREIVEDLLGDRLRRPCWYTHELVEMRPDAVGTSSSCGVALPRSWGWDSLWLPRRLVGVRRVAGAEGDVRLGTEGRAA